MKIKFSLTITFIWTLGFVFGQTIKSKDSTNIKIRGTGIYYIDGFRVYTKLTKNDSIKILKDVATKINGKWTSTENKIVFIDEYEISEATFKGRVYNLDVILAAPYLRLELISGQIKLISSRTIGETFVDDDTLNISISDNELNINNLIHRRQKSK